MPALEVITRDKSSAPRWPWQEPGPIRLLTHGRRSINCVRDRYIHYVFHPPRKVGDMMASVVLVRARQPAQYSLHTVCLGNQQAERSH